MSKFNPFDPANGYSEEDRAALSGKCSSLINGLPLPARTGPGTASRPGARHPAGAGSPAKPEHGTHPDRNRPLTEY